MQRIKLYLKVTYRNKIKLRILHNLILLRRVVSYKMKARVFKKAKKRKTTKN